ncbi:MAG: aromatic-ring-hydroxylating dioxygenase subunit beta [Hyphomonadaceae bacterium]
MAQLAAVPATSLPARAEVEDFLFLEAQLLDEWKLDEWLQLFAEGATYEVPAAGSGNDADAKKQLFYVADDWARLRFRVERLKSPMAHAEYPRSHTARLISNVRVLGEEAGGWKVRSAFITYRSKDDVTDAYFGHHFHILKRIGGELKIASKRSQIDSNSLRPQGRVSIIV